MTRKIKLVGGECDGEERDVPSDIRDGDVFRVSVMRDSKFSFEPEIVTYSDVLYRVQTIHRGEGVWRYGIPGHWNPVDGLRHLFGPEERASGK